jgi:DNA-binding response OmpR family regulator
MSAREGEELECEVAPACSASKRVLTIYGVLPEPQPRLLLVEDDEKLSRTLVRGLEQEGYAVDAAYAGDTALAKAGERDYHAILLDVMLPGVDGRAVCRALRDRDRWVPVLMLTALGDVTNRIDGLDAGADDYLVKPFDFGELLARVRALIRRGPSERPAAIEVGDLRADPRTRAVYARGRTVDLTEREFALLEYLLRRPGLVVTRTQLLEHVWGSDHDGSPNVVDVYIGYLRRKLDAPAGRRLIRTVRGRGFVLDAQ